MPSIKDVSIEAGVSTATVSRVLSGKPGVHPELRVRVLRAVEKLKYRPNRIARSLRSQRSRTIGLVVSDIRNPYFTAVSRTVEDMAYEHGYTVFQCNTDENPEREALYLEVLEDENVAGVILSPTKDRSDNFDGASLGTPTVILDRAVRSGDADMVLIDNVESAARLALHLIGNGYRRIGGFFGEASTTGRERRKGFERALRENELTPVAVQFLPPNIQAGYTAALDLLRSADRPEAMLTSNSLLAAGILQAIRELDLRMPDEVALACFDDAVWSTLVQPSITVIAQPTQEIGKTAVELLLQRIEDPGVAYRQVILKGKLIVRGSTAPRGE